MTTRSVVRCAPIASRDPVRAAACAGATTRASGTSCRSSLPRLGPSGRGGRDSFRVEPRHDGAAHLLGEGDAVADLHGLKTRDEVRVESETGERLRRHLALIIRRPLYSVNVFRFTRGLP